MAYLDSFARPIEYLRISVTDRCNLRCIYCMPPEGLPLLGHEDILRYEEIERLARAALGLGITRFRLTGGEPLARRGILDLVGMLAALPGLADLSMTTNGTLLAGYAERLAQAGLRRVNISLDTLQPERFRHLTQVGELEDVLLGIKAAEAAGLRPLKLNMVVMRNFNDDEVVDFARLALEHEWCVRFIELMPLGHMRLAEKLWREKGFVPMEEVREHIQAALGTLEPVDRERIASNGPAEYFRLPGAKGTLGFITPVTQHFCSHCNRLRLTADGRLRPCLFSDLEIDVRSALRSGASNEKLGEILREAIQAKPQGHQLEKWLLPEKRGMSQIGG